MQEWNMVISSVCTHPAVSVGWAKFSCFSPLSSQRLSTFLIRWCSHSPNRFYYWLCESSWLNRFKQVKQQNFATTGHFEQEVESIHTAPFQRAWSPRGQKLFWCCQKESRAWEKRCRDLQEDSSMDWDSYVLPSHLPGQFLWHPCCKMRCSSRDAAVLQNADSNNGALASLKILV